MCYSLTVQLVTAIVILGSVAVYAVRFFRNDAFREPWRRSFLVNSALVFVCVGLHQFFEFLAIFTGNSLLYRIGLVVSICAPLFLIRSLESLANRSWYSTFALIPISLVSLHVFIVPLEFSAVSFYVRHSSAFFWAATWMLLFVYWHLVAFMTYASLPDRDSRRTLILYLIALADLSFILSALYVLYGHVVFAVNVCTDAPSIWCTFYAIQALIYPLILWRIGSAFVRPEPASTDPIRALRLLLFAFVILLLLIATLPAFGCLSLKFVFP